MNGKKWLVASGGWLVMLLVTTIANAGYPCCYKTYTPVTYAAPYVAPYVAPITDPGWRSKHADLKYNLAKIAADSSDYQASLASLAGHPLGYGTPSVAAAGTALYSSAEYARGYGAEELLQSKSQTLDPHVMANQRGRFLEHAASLNRDLAQQTDDSAKLEHSNNLELEKLRLATSGYERIVRAAAVPEASKTVTQYAPTVARQVTDRTTVYGSSSSRPDTRGDGGDRQAFINQACVSCHSKDNPQGGLVLTDYASLSAEDKDLCQQRVDSDDPTERMPKVKTADGFGPGKRLSLSQKLLFAN